MAIYFIYTKYKPQWISDWSFLRSLIPGGVWYDPLAETKCSQSNFHMNEWNEMKQSNDSSRCLKLLSLFYGEENIGSPEAQSRRGRQSAEQAHGLRCLNRTREHTPLKSLVVKRETHIWLRAHQMSLGPLYGHTLNNFLTPISLSLSLLHTHPHTFTSMHIAGGR